MKIQYTKKDRLVLILIFIFLLIASQIWSQFQKGISVGGINGFAADRFNNKLYCSIYDTPLLGIAYIALVLISYFGLKKANIKRIMKYLIFLVVCFPGLWYINMTFPILEILGMFVMLFKDAGQQIR